MMMPIEWNSKFYKINGEPGFLISGEFHYFRVPKEDWGRRLDLFMEAGGNCVATYIPWILHEPVEGEIRFGDIPERDLEGFLTLCRDKGIYVICRPGPYQYSEMKYNGLPGWLCDGYPEIESRDVQGKGMGKDSVSYLHPTFLEKVKKWFDAACRIISKHTVKNGGAVAFVQFDNELMGIHEWYSGGWDYNPETIGLGKEDGRYARFLRSRFESIDALNAAYETEFGGFIEVLPFGNTGFKSFGDRRRVKDYQDFYFSMIAEYAATLTGWMREAGIDCDFVHNSGNPTMNAYFLETVSRLGERFILGSDHYYNLDMDWAANNPTPQYAQKVFYSNEMMRLLGFPSTVFELPGGSCSDWPPITPEDLEACYMTNIAFGMKGFNYYIFTGGPNPLNIGGNGKIYDYGAAIGPDNTIRKHYYTQKEFGAFLKDNSWLAGAEKISDFYLGLDFEYTRSRQYSEDSSGFGSFEAWGFMQKGFLITSLCASYAPEFLDLSCDSLVHKIDKPLIIAASACMAAAVQERLIRFVKNGGRLLISPVIPHMDENFYPCTILKEFLEDASVEHYNSYNKEVNVGPLQSVFINAGLWVSCKHPEGSLTIAEEVNSGKAAAWKKNYQGGGMVIWQGLQWKYTRNEHLNMMKYLLGELGCETPCVICDNPNVWISLRGDGDSSMLFIMNLFSAPMEANLKVKEKEGYYRDLGTCFLKSMEVKTLAL